MFLSPNMPTSKNHGQNYTTVSGLVYVVFLCDRIIGYGAKTLLRQMDMRSLTLGVCRAHEGGSGTNKSAQELTRKTS